MTDISLNFRERGAMAGACEGEHVGDAARDGRSTRSATGRESLRFAFGRNWQGYVDRHLDKEAVATARRQTAEFLRLESLRGKTFPDIACGSGLFLLSAFQLDAARVFSFDLDRDSVACCAALHEMAGRPKNWEIQTCSILDDAYVSTLPVSDVVYSWGVLHHTGEMYPAIDSAVRLVAPGGLLCIAIYNKVEYGFLNGVRGSNFWLRVKRSYCRSGALTRWLMLRGFEARGIMRFLLAGKNPIREIRNYSSQRRMSWSVDVRDWVGGYPFECARVDEIFRHCKFKHGLTLENLDASVGSGTGCIQYLLQKPFQCSDTR